MVGTVGITTVIVIIIFTEAIVGVFAVTSTAVVKIRIMPVHTMLIFDIFNSFVGLVEYIFFFLILFSPLRLTTK